MNFEVGGISELFFFVNPHTQGIPKFKPMDEHPEVYQSIDKEFLAIPTGDTVFVVDTDESLITPATQLSLVPTPEEANLKDYKASVRELCTEFRSSTIQNSIRKGEQLMIDRAADYEFNQEDSTPEKRGLIGEFFPFCETATTDLDVYPLDGLLCIDDLTYAKANAAILSSKYTGFTPEIAAQHAKQTVEVVKIQVPLEEEYYNLVNDLNPDEDSPALPVLINVLKAIENPPISESLHSHIVEKLGSQLDMRRLKFYGVLLALHCCSNSCELPTISRCLRMTESQLKELLSNVGIRVQNNIVSLSCIKFKLFERKPSRPKR